MNEQYDPYEEYHRQHPMFIKGAEQERERIISILEAEGFEYRPTTEHPHNLIGRILDGA